MPKQIVVCIDGTWNSPDQTAVNPHGVVSRKCPTNVFRTWAAIAGQQKIKPSQNLAHEKPGLSAIYLQGIGTEGQKLRRRFAGVTGLGMSETIRKAYLYIASNWETGAEIYLFGFSRGAFAARSTAGMLDYIGLPDGCKTPGSVDALYSAYRARHANVKSIHSKSIPVHFLGLWDTVAALGLTNIAASWHHISPPNVTTIRHALALDEERSQFAPLFWNDHSSPKKLKEVWFAGAHANIGGGYFDSNLSNIAYLWMLKEAGSVGLHLDLKGLPQWEKENYQVPGINSWEDFWKPLGSLQRLNIARANRKILDTQYVHESVFDAIIERAKFAPYIPLAIIDRLKWAKEEFISAKRFEPWGFEMTEPENPYRY